MYAAIPVYYPSLEAAARKDEAALWCDSYNINMDCRNFIQAKAMTVMNSRELDSFIGELVRFYGVERAIYVLSRTIQFSDTGLHPADARHARHLDAAALGVPVIAAGIPTLMDADEGADLVLTPRALDSVIAHGSALLAGILNRALQPRLSVAQLCWLTG